MVSGHGYGAHLSSFNSLRQLHNMTSAFMTMMSGIPRFFSPRSMNPWSQITGQKSASSYYDTSKLFHSLNDLIDWDLLNNQQHRLSVGAVNMKTGNFRYFDSAFERLNPKHTMASGALPPAFPAVEIDNEYYWDGGIVCNTLL